MVYCRSNRWFSNCSERASRFSGCFPDTMVAVILVKLTLLIINVGLATVSTDVWHKWNIPYYLVWQNRKKYFFSPPWKRLGIFFSFSSAWWGHRPPGTRNMRLEEQSLLTMFAGHLSPFCHPSPYNVEYVCIPVRSAPRSACRSTKGRGRSAYRRHQRSPTLTSTTRRCCPTQRKTWPTTLCIIDRSGNYLFKSYRD